MTSSPSDADHPEGTPQALSAATRADRVAAAATAVPGVSALHAGVHGEVATYLPGRRVNGVRIAADTADVHVVVTMGFALLEVADQVVAAVEPLVETPVRVVVEDVAPAAGSR